jgi:hypothetical protein
MRFPIKFVVLMIFALPLLAAFAIARFKLKQNETSDDTREQIRWSIIVSSLLAIVIVGACVYALQHPFANLKTGTLLLNASLRLACLAIVLALLFRFKSVAHSGRQKLLQGCLVATIGIDAWTHAPNQNPTVAPMVYEMRVVARELNVEHEAAPRAFMSRTTHDLLYGAMIPDTVKDFTGRRYGLFGNCNLLDGIPVTDGFYSLYLPEQRELWTRLFFATNFPAPLADFLGISRISTNVFDWKPRPSAQPLITIGARPVFADRADTVRGLLSPSFNSKEIVYLPPDLKESVKARSAAAEIISSSLSSSKGTIRTRATEPSLVVIAQSWYHRWQATVDGRPSPIWRANHAFQAVEVPAGEHEVKLAYQDRPFHWGALISGATLATCGLGWFSTKRRSENDEPAAATD